MNDTVHICILNFELDKPFDFEDLRKFPPRPTITKHLLN